MRIFIAFIISLLSSVASAHSCDFSKENSVEKLSCEKIEALAQYHPSGVVEFRLIFKDQFSLTLEVIQEKEFNTTSGFTFNDKRALPALTQSETLEITKLAKVIYQDSYFTDPQFIRFFKLLPAQTNLSSLREVARNTPLRKSIKEDYIVLCHFVGLYRKGFYNVDDDSTIYSEKVTVGDHDSHCYGRCGSGCNDDSPSYTQQCLNHDICHRSTGENLGVCSDEFWMAAPGYMWAPLCILKL